MDKHKVQAQVARDFPIELLIQKMHLAVLERLPQQPLQDSIADLHSLKFAAGKAVKCILEVDSKVRDQAEWMHAVEVCSQIRDEAVELLEEIENI